MPSLPSSATAPAAFPAAGRGWRAYHLHYHADRDRLLRLLVAPLCASLLAEGLAASFYFVRYPLGGPHVRLRLLPRPGRARAAAARVEAAAAAFFAEHPSREALSDEAVHRVNREVLSDDPGAEDVVVPDNTLRPASVGLEVERYGGPELLRHSLCFFAISSVDVLRALAGSPEPTPAVRLTLALRALLRQAWGLAPTLDQVGTLGAYAAYAFNGALDGFRARADVAFERGREALCARVGGELEALAEGDELDAEAPAWMGGAARSLAREIAAAGEGRRRRIACSQLHMTANRLGLRNPEEAYVGRLLQRSLEAVGDSDPALWRRLADAHRARAGAEGGAPLHERTRAALRGFALGQPAATQGDRLRIHA